MFKETHIDNTGTFYLTFLNSLKVKAYPCGRRRAELGDDGYLPFDPEARLNTELNARKHSGLNGFTQTYFGGLSADGKSFDLSLGGYLFTVDITDKNGVLSLENIAENIIAALTAAGEAATTATKIYANVLLEEIPLYYDEKLAKYTTWVLRDMSSTADPSTSLDVATADAYYFSGLAFSTKPVAAIADDLAYGVSYKDRIADAKLSQQAISLCILEKNSDRWQIYQPALLPKIVHDTGENSIKTFGNLTVNGNIKGNDMEVSKLSADEILQDDHKLVTLDITKGDNGYRLSFSGAQHNY
jgi:hypothetical protein